MCIKICARFNKYYPELNFFSSHFFVINAFIIIYKKITYLCSVTFENL